MENRDNATVPAQSATKLKGRDFEAVPDTSHIKPDDPPAVPPPPRDFDPSAPRQGGNEARH